MDWEKNLESTRKNGETKSKMSAKWVQNSTKLASLPSIYLSLALRLTEQLSIWKNQVIKVSISNTQNLFI